MITIVSGIPRSGTSLMMQMLAVGGMTLLTDTLRVADENNPRGYCEWEPVKTLQKTPEVIKEAEGKAVKVISSLLFSLPSQYRYDVIFMTRELDEIIASQNAMLTRLGKNVPPAATESVASAFQRHLEHVRSWISKQPNMRVLYVGYIDILKKPEELTREISHFLEKSLDTAAMCRQVEQSLYRERSKLRAS